MGKPTAMQEVRQLYCLFIQAAAKRWEEDCISACLGHEAKALADVKRSGALFGVCTARQGEWAAGCNWVPTGNAGYKCPQIHCFTMLPGNPRRTKRRKGGRVKYGRG